jgi:hypothetical protein
LKYKDFSDEFLVAAYQESRLKPGETLNSGEIIDRYPLVFEPGWVIELVHDLGVRGYLASKGVDSDDRGQPVRLTGRGLRVAEELIEKGVGIFRLDLGDGIGFPAAQPTPQFEDSEQTDALPHSALDDTFLLNGGPVLPSVESSAWTGRTLSTTQKAELVVNLDEALTKIDSLTLTQEKRAQARAFLRAVRELADAPDPPFDLIEFMLRHVDRIIGIAGFFVGVASLMATA